MEKMWACELDLSELKALQTKTKVMFVVKVGYADPHCGKAQGVGHVRAELRGWA